MAERPPLASLLPQVVLGSASVARRLLLEAEGVEVMQVASNTNEVQRGNNLGEVVESLALQKLAAVRTLHKLPSWPILTADTLIDFAGRAIGKSSSRYEALKQLQSFSAHTHAVYSGYALFLGDSQETFSGFEKTIVHFNDLTLAELEEYLDTGEYIGVAGCYQIQGQGSRLIRAIEGYESVVVGLPIEAIFAILDQRVKT